MKKRYQILIIEDGGVVAERQYNRLDALLSEFDPETSEEIARELKGDE